MIFICQNRKWLWRIFWGAHIIDVENWETENDVDVYEGEKFDANEENFDAEDDMLDQALDASKWHNSLRFDFFS